MSRLWKIVVVLAALGWSSPVFAAWPPVSDAPPEQAFDLLLAEVREIALKDADPTRRGWAWRALNKVNDRELAKLYPAGIADPHPFVRGEAVLSLGLFVVGANDEAKAARIAAVQALADPHKFVSNRGGFVVAREKPEVDWSGLGLAADVPGVDSTAGLNALWHSRKYSDEIWHALLREMRSSHADRWNTLNWLLTDEAETPDKWKAEAVAVGLACDEPDVRVLTYEAIEPAFTGYCARCLADRDPEVRRQAFRLKYMQEIDDAEKHRALINQALRDEAEIVVLAAIQHARANRVNIDVDLDLIRQRATAERFREVDTAVLVLLKAETQALSGAERVAYLDSLRRRFAEAPVGGRERRLAAGLLARTVHDHYGDGNLLGNEARRTGFTRGFLNLEQAIPQTAKTLVALTNGATDSDPYVRFAVCRALTAGVSPALTDGKLTEAQAAAAWLAVLSLTTDPHRDVRHALAVRLQLIDDAIVRDDELRRATEAAALQLLADETKIARAAVRYFMRRAWRPEAAPILLAELRDRPESRKDDPFGPATDSFKLRNDAFIELLLNAPQELPRELFIDCLAEAALEGWSRFQPSRAETLGLEHLRAADGLDLLLERITDALQFSDLVLATRVSAGEKWDAADVSDVLDYITSLTPERIDVTLKLIEDLEKVPAELTRDRFAAVARDVSASPRLRYPLIAGEKTLASPTLAEVLASPDPVAALLAAHATGPRTDLAVAADAPPYVHVLAQESKRRR